MTYTLMTTFPNTLNYTKASALAWSGLEMTPSCELLSSFKKTEIADYYKKFKNFDGTNNGYGTACQ